jgi:intracellular septation protein A
LSDLPSNRPVEQPAPPSASSIFRPLMPSVILNGVLPVVLYQFLRRDGVAPVPSLVAGSIFPIGFTALGWLRTRRLDLIASVSLFYILLSTAASLISGSTRFTLLKDSFFTGLFGLIFLGSLLRSRPLMFYIAQQFATGGDPDRRRSWDHRWQHAAFRHVMRVMTAIWGTMLIADALIRTGLVFVLSTSVFLVVSQGLFYGMFALTLVGTLTYGRWMQRRATQQEAVQERSPTT